MIYEMTTAHLGNVWRDTTTALSHALMTLCIDSVLWSPLFPLCPPSRVTTLRPGTDTAIHRFAPYTLLLYIPLVPGIMKGKSHYFTGSAQNTVPSLSISIGGPPVSGRFRLAISRPPFHVALSKIWARVRDASEAPPNLCRIRPAIRSLSSINVSQISSQANA